MYKVLEFFLILTLFSYKMFFFLNNLKIRLLINIRGYVYCFIIKGQSMPSHNNFFLVFQRVIIVGNITDMPMTLDVGKIPEYSLIHCQTSPVCDNALE